MIVFQILHSNMTPEALGILPLFFDVQDPDSAAVQIDKHYQHGGGWNPMKGFTMDKNGTLHYPGDPAFVPLADAKLRDERIIFYEGAFVAVVQPDGSFEVARVD